MKKIFSAAILLTLVTAMPATAAKKTILKTPLDSASYALGVNVGMGLQNQLGTLPGDPVKMDLFLEALSSYLQTGDTTNMAIKPSKTPVIINNYLQKAQADQFKKDKARNDAFLAKNATQPGVHVTKSGLQYMMLQNGTGDTPAVTDKVKVNYTGTLTNGKVFDSTTGRGPAEFELNKVIPGWTEGLQLMNIGSKYRFWIPAELGYGSRAMGNSIPANSILVFDVELLDIGKATAQQSEAPKAKYTFPAYQKK
jgi:FKBP-type peptidyl-prolyl cis-trans isomerase FkpA